VLPEVLRGLIFDMDGLMIDSEPVWWRVEHALAREFGVAWTDALALSCMGTGLPNLIRTMRAHGLPLDEATGVERVIDDFIARIGEVELLPGCVELLDAARERGIRVALASSSTRGLVEAVLAQFRLADRFDAAISGEAVSRPKPAPDIFLLAAERLGVDVGEAVVLEDSRAGVTAARDAGIAVIAIPEGDPTPFVPIATLVLRDLHEARARLGLG